MFLHFSSMALSLVFLSPSARALEFAEIFKQVVHKKVHYVTVKIDVNGIPEGVKPTETGYDVQCACGNSVSFAKTDENGWFKANLTRVKKYNLDDKIKESFGIKNVCFGFEMEIHAPVFNPTGNQEGNTKVIKGVTFTMIEIDDIEDPAYNATPDVHWYMAKSEEVDNLDEIKKEFLVWDDVTREFTVKFQGEEKKYRVKSKTIHKCCGNNRYFHTIERKVSITDGADTWEIAYESDLSDTECNTLENANGICWNDASTTCWGRIERGTTVFSGHWYIRAPVVLAVFAILGLTFTMLSETKFKRHLAGDKEALIGFFVFFLAVFILCFLQSIMSVMDSVPCCKNDSGCQQCRAYSGFGKACMYGFAGSTAAVLYSFVTNDEGNPLSPLEILKKRSGRPIFPMDEISDQATRDTIHEVLLITIMVIMFSLFIWSCCVSCKWLKCPGSCEGKFRPKECSVENALC